MKLLFDQNLSFKLCRLLADVFPGSSQVHLLGLGTADDRSLRRHAGENAFVLVSLDADFAELAALLGPPPKTIWLRCGNRPTAEIAALLRDRAAAIVAFEQSDSACLEIY